MNIKLENNIFCQAVSEGMFDEPIDKYHAVKAIGSTLLRTFMNSRAQFAHLWAGGEKKKSEAFTIGSALHCLVLEPKDFMERFACAPVEINRRTKAGKEQWASFCAANENKETLTQDQYESVVKMAENISETELAYGLLSGAEREKSARVKLSNGLIVQCRPDAMKQNAIIDIKTCAGVDRFKYDVRSHGYHIQAAFYYFILSRIMPEAYADADFYFIVVDKTIINEVLVTGIDNASLRLVLDEIVKPALSEMGNFFSEVDDIQKIVTFQKEMQWLNIV